MPAPPLHKAAVLGSPISHSLSPRLHNYWLNKYGIDGSYEAIDTKPEQLRDTLFRLRDGGYAGCNLTLPLKEHAVEFMSDLDEMSSLVRAVNMVTICPDGSFKGENTDGVGFVSNLVFNSGPVTGKNVLVLGAGGAARSICAILQMEGCTIMLLNRTRSHAEAIKRDLLGHNIEVYDWDDYPVLMKHADLLVNTTSLGMKGKPPLDISLNTLPSSARVTDIVYNPLTTPLLATARARGNSVIEGLGMLLYQAQPAFEAWFERKPEVDRALYNYVAEALR